MLSNVFLQIRLFACLLTIQAVAIITYASSPSVWIPVLPEKLTFCGQQVPLDRVPVKEQLDAMFTIMCIDNRGQMILWYKRANRILPIAKKIIMNAGLPSDLVYMAVAESDLLPRAKSPTGAYGIWQFMTQTAKDEGMFVRDGLDERGDYYKATMAAASYLKELYGEFNNDWFLAMAAYNCGPSNIHKMMNAQHAQSYWDSVPIRETAVYVPRIVLIKELFEHPRTFGIAPDSVTQYPPLATDRIVVTLDNSVPFSRICEWAEMDYRSMLFYNPQVANPSCLKDVSIPANKMTTFEIPKEKAGHFRTILSEHGKVE